MKTNRSAFPVFSAGSAAVAATLAKAGGAFALLAPLLLLPAAHAQTPALTPATGTAAAQPAAARAASAPASAAKPAPRYLTPDEKRDSATAPGTLRPTDPVVPQLRIALGRNGNAASTAGDGAIDDDAARCRAQASAADRARCGAGVQKVLPKPSLRP